MQATEQRVDRLNPCEGPCVPQGIDRARMPAARQYHQALVTHMHHEGLVVMDERVGLPGAIDFCIVDRKALFEVRAAMDLAGDEDQPFHDNGGKKPGMRTPLVQSQATLAVLNIHSSVGILVSS